MPRKPMRPCNAQGCPELISNGRYCDKHQKQEYQRQDSRRGTPAERGYDSRWRKYRNRFLREHPLCVHCLAEGRTTAATVVDHVIPHRGDYTLFWDPGNHQPLCATHHGIKTAKEDGGFGNRKG